MLEVGDLAGGSAERRGRTASGTNAAYYLQCDFPDLRLVLKLGVTLIFKLLWCREDAALPGSSPSFGRVEVLSKVDGSLCSNGRHGAEAGLAPKTHDVEFRGGGHALDEAEVLQLRHLALQVAGGQSAEADLVARTVRCCILSFVIFVTRQQSLEEGRPALEREDPSKRRAHSRSTAACRAVAMLPRFLCPPAAGAAEVALVRVWRVVRGAEGGEKQELGVVG